MNHRPQLAGTLLFAFALALQAQTTPSAGSVELIRAQGELERLRGLVQVGAVAPAKLAEAEQNLGDAQDDAVLRQTLYGSITAQDLTEQQATEMVNAAQRRYDRQKAKLDRYDGMVSSGVLARNEIEPLRLELDSRKLTLDLAHSRARLLDEIAALAQSEKEYMRAERAGVPVDHRVMEKFEGDGTFTPTDLAGVETAYQSKFHRTLPISANGESSVHRALGFDHRGRVDVAVQPDTAEGQWLRSYLTSRDIPYYAFRAALPGKATGPHIHIGPGSTRLRAAD